jgi:hypothetical protein
MPAKSLKYPVFSACFMPVAKQIRAHIAPVIIAYRVRRHADKPIPAASNPPSTANLWPLLQLAAGLHKNPTLSVIFSGLPRRADAASNGLR